MPVMKGDSQKADLKTTNGKDKRKDGKVLRKTRLINGIENET